MLLCFSSTISKYFLSAVDIKKKIDIKNGKYSNSS